MPDYPKPPYPSQRQPMPGSTEKMDPRPDHGETSYRGRRPCRICRQAALSSTPRR
jgi:hypothetical protein